MTPFLTDLIARVERAEIGSIELDLDIAVALGRWSPPVGYTRDDRSSPVWRKPGVTCRQPHQPVTASLDAALALVEAAGPPNLLEVSGGWNPADKAEWPAWLIRWYPPHVSVDGKSWRAIVASARTPALALCSALLRAVAERGGA